jgi:hypothetical protein
MGRRRRHERRSGPGAPAVEAPVATSDPPAAQEAPQVADPTPATPAPQAATPPPPPAPPAQAGFSLGASDEINGAAIKNLREARGMSIKDVSERTRIRVSTLTALEDERFEDLPDARIYVRGFIRCIAVELGVDPDRAGADYLARWERWRDAQLPAKRRRP